MERRLSSWRTARTNLVTCYVGCRVLSILLEAWGRWGRSALIFPWGGGVTVDGSDIELIHLQPRNPDHKYCTNQLSTICQRATLCHIFCG